MTDPRFTDPDPRSSDSRFDDPYLRHGEFLGGVWFWVPALGFVLLIGALILANNYNEYGKQGFLADSYEQPACTHTAEHHGFRLVRAARLASASRTVSTSSEIEYPRWG